MTKTTLQVKTEIDLPSLPNFVKSPIGTIDVADIYAEDLREIGVRWTEALIEHSRQRRAERLRPEATP